MSLLDNAVSTPEIFIRAQTGRLGKIPETICSSHRNCLNATAPLDLKNKCVSFFLGRRGKPTGSAGGNCRNLRLQAKVAFRSAKEAFAWVTGKTTFLQSYCQQAACVEFPANHY